MSEVPWETLIGGYRLPYDPRPALASIVDGNGDWDALWQDLYHQGDIGTASYAAVPLIAELAQSGFAADWNVYALPVAIEEARGEGENPPLPDWAEARYRAAWERLFEIGMGVFPATNDETLSTSILALFAVHKGLPALARLAMFSEEERLTFLDQVGWA